MEFTRVYTCTCSWTSHELTKNSHVIQFLQVRPQGAPGLVAQCEDTQGVHGRQGEPSAIQVEAPGPEATQEVPWDDADECMPHAHQAPTPLNPLPEAEQDITNAGGGRCSQKTRWDDVPMGRSLLSKWNLRMDDVRHIAGMVQDRAKASQPRPVPKLMDLLTLEHLCLALCLIKEESSSADSAHTREEMWNDPEPWLASLHQELQEKTYQPSPIRRSEIPKGDGTMRPLGQPSLRDKVVQMALLLILDPLLDPHFIDNSVGFRLMKQPQQAIHRIRKALEGFPKGWVLDLDLKSYFDTIPWAPLLQMLKQYVGDPDLLRLIQLILMTPVRTKEGKLEYPTKGSPQGGVLSPLLANLYLHHILDTWLTTHIRKQIRGCMEFARFADDIVITVSHEEDAKLIHQKVMEQMEAHGLTINKDKTKLVNMTRPGRDAGCQDHSFPFLGFQFSWQPHQDRGWRLANVISESSIKKSLMRIQRWLEHHSLEPMTDDFCEYPARALGRRMAGFYGYYPHPHPDDVWALQKHNSQALQMILESWGPQGLSPEDEADVRYVMDPAHRVQVFQRYRHRPKRHESQPRRAEAFDFHFLSN